MVENNYSDIDARKLNKIKPPGIDTMTKTADMLLSEEEVQRMIAAATTSRDRAILSVLYEGGLRIGELGSMTWNDVHFTDVNVTLNTDAKTAKPRFIPLYTSKPYLIQWKNDYPLKIEPSSFVFLTATTHKSLTYDSIAHHIQLIAQKAGITKHITPHIFRHSRVTHLIQQKVPETVIKKMIWGNITSNMFQTYAHLTDNDVENSLAELNGIKLDTSAATKRKKRMLPVQCPKCATINTPTAAYCSTCGVALAEEAKDEQTTHMDELRKLLADPVFVAQLSQQMLK